jgi:hypothetical protein
MDDRQIKLWVLYPWHPNTAAFKKTSNSSARYPACEKELVGGCFALTLPGEGLKLPPGCLHATFTIRGGSLLGSTFSVAEGVAVCAEILKIDALMGNMTSQDHLTPFIQSLHAAVVAELEVTWRTALEQLCDISSSQFRDKKRDKDVAALVRRIRLHLSTKITESCQHCEKSIGEHFPLTLSPSAHVTRRSAARSRK